MRSNWRSFPLDILRDLSIFPRSSRLLKMFNAGGQVPTETEAPASASALAIAKPKPPSSATPATSALRPERSMLSILRICPKRQDEARGKRDGICYSLVKGTNHYFGESLVQERLSRSSFLIQPRHYGSVSDNRHAL